MNRFAAAALWCVIFAFGLFVSSRFGKSSDQANILLAGIDMLHGNWRLRGWSMVADTYWTSDVALGAILSGLRDLFGLPEVAPATLVIQPAVSWATLGTLAVATAQRGIAGAMRRWFAALIVFAAAIVPCIRPEGPLPLAFLSGIHILTLAYALAAFALAASAVDTASKPWRLVVPLGAVALLGEAGDPLFLFVAVLPLLLALPLAPAAASRRRLAVGGAVALGAAAGQLAVRANVATGGFTVEALPTDFASFGDLGTNVAVTLHGLLALFGADFTGRTPATAIPELLHLPQLLLAAAVTWTMLLRSGRTVAALRPGTLDLTTASLAVGVVIDVLALVTSRHVEWEAASYATARYLFPAWMFSAILLARALAADRLVRLLACTALASALLVDVRIERQELSPALNASQAALLDVLRIQPARQGLAGYWEASLLQVASQDRLAIRACVPDGSGRLVPMHRANKSFTMADATREPFFVVVQRQLGYFTRDQVLATFGPPSGTRGTPDFEVLFYPGRAS